MSSDNPYAVSDQFSGSGDPTLQPPPDDWFRVEGRSIVCGPSVTLPRVCALTGAGASDVELVQVGMMVSFPSFRIVIRQRTCTVRYFVSRKLNRRKVWCRALGTVLLLLTPFVVFSGMAVLVPLGIILLLTGIGLHGLYGVQLYVDRYQAPNVYWIRGFHEKAIAEFERIEKQKSHGAT